MWDDSIVLTHVSLDVMSFEITNGAIFVVACFSRCIFKPESAITGVFYWDNLVGFR